MKVKLLSIALVTSIIISIGLAYTLVDISVSLTYSNASFDSCVTDFRRLERLLEGSWRGLSEAEVLKKLKAEAARHSNEDASVSVEKGTIRYEDIQFQFKDGKLISIGEQQ